MQICNNSKILFGAGVELQKEINNYGKCYNNKLVKSILTL